MTGATLLDVLLIIGGVVLLISLAAPGVPRDETVYRACGCPEDKHDEHCPLHNLES